MTDRWALFLETGGTFTDGLAVSPGGTVHRAKVLSSGALRGVVKHVPDAGPIIVSGCSHGLGLMLGATVRTLAGRDRGRIIHDQRAGTDWALTLDGASAKQRWQVGDALEISTGEDAPVLAARLLTRTPFGSPLPLCDVRLATTRGTNALLTRAVAPCCLFITRGFADLLTIGTQARPDIFALDIKRPAALHNATVQVVGRLDAAGVEIEPLDLDALRAAATQVLRSGVSSAAVVLVHADVAPLHERTVGALLQEVGFAHVALSHLLAPEIGFLKRARTTVVNAALAPVIGAYLGAVDRAFASGPGSAGSQPTPARRMVMASSGGLVGAPLVRPKDMLFSGPASGVVGALVAARQSGLRSVITFDMGGTSTDVARLGGEGLALQTQYVFEHRVGDALISAPAVAVESVAAGGGSICAFDPARGLTVGPRSAGAHPGPACYGAGGPLTLTDCNLLLGRLDATSFAVPIQLANAQAAAEHLRAQVEHSTGRRLTCLEMVEGLVRIADETMAGAIRTISVQKGFDPRGFTLLAFGGAGGQHACGVAEALSMGRVLIPPDVGLLSARGLAGARVEGVAQRQVLRELASESPWFGPLVEKVAGQAAASALNEGANGAIDERLFFDVRLVGMDTPLTIEFDQRPVHPAQLREAFLAQFKQEFGFMPGARTVELVAVRVVAGAAGSGPLPAEPAMQAGAPALASPSCSPSETPAGDRFNRALLRPGQQVVGPALIVETHGTTVVKRGWTCTVDAHRALFLERAEPLPAPAAEAAKHAHHDPVELELLTARLSAIATDMGETLRRVSLSTNVKERLDFSCAVLDAHGELIVNAPHLPVHLGALGVTVRALMATLTIAPGDVVLTNHPAFGGSHLPDVTVVSPVFVQPPAGRPTLLGFVASRAHHAEIGGIRPGSMPPNAANLAEEGVVLPPMHLVRDGVSCAHEVEALLRAGPYPSRAVPENMADLAAQVAANQRGVHALLETAGPDPDRLHRGMEHMKARAANVLQRALLRIGDRQLTASEALDDGSAITVRITITRGRALVDFAGSAPVHPGNFNAPAGIVRSALMYVLRTMLDEPLPLNEGLMRCIDLRIPGGMLNPVFPSDPTNAPPVCAGNVETSQRVVDVLIKALGLCAASQGTMNNIIFGDASFGYYETVCGGSGAGPGFAGASAVHTHMTNTRITDVEVIERRFPVRIERFGVRHGSGGAGTFAGGDGAVREYLFTRQVALSILSQRRATGPFGGARGECGVPGRQVLVRASGDSVELPGVCAAELCAGDRLILETPGGGGWGAPTSADHSK